MSRPCSVCSNLNRRAVDTQLAQGASVQQVARNSGIGESSLRRHVARHLSAGLLREVRASSDIGDADLIDTLVQVLHDVSAVRQVAIATGQSGLVLRSATATREIVGDVLTLLGVDAASVSQQLLGGQVLAKATARVIRVRPEFGTLLAENLDSLNDLEMATHVRELVHRSSKGITE